MPVLRMQTRVQTRLPWELQPKRSWQPPSFQRKMQPQAAAQPLAQPCLPGLSGPYPQLRRLLPVEEQHSARRSHDLSGWWLSDWWLSGLKLSGSSRVAAPSHCLTPDCPRPHCESTRPHRLQRLRPQRPCQQKPHQQGESRAKGWPFWQHRKLGQHPELHPELDPELDPESGLHFGPRSQAAGVLRISLRRSLRCSLRRQPSLRKLREFQPESWPSVRRIPQKPFPVATKPE